MNLDGLIAFGHDIVGINKSEALALFFFLYLFKKFADKYKAMKESKLENLNILITELEKENQKNHDFIIEQVFRKKFGVLVDYPIISFFLNSRTPSKDLYDYMAGKIYLSFDENYRKINFKNNYTVDKLIFKRRFAFFLYAISGGVLFLSIKWLFLSDNTSYWYLYINSVLLILSFMMMIMCLSDGCKQDPAIRIFKKYNKVDRN